MQMRYVRDLSHNYLIPEVKARYVKEDYQIHMLTENQIPGLLKMQVHHMDGMTEFYYDVTAKSSLGSLYETTYMKEEDIVRIIHGLYDVIHATEKYLLSVNHIVLDPSCIYMDEQNKMPQFCYLPEYEELIEDSFLKLAEYILHHLDQNDARAVLTGYEIYRQVSQKHESLEAVFKRILDSSKDVSKEKKEMPPERTFHVTDPTADSEQEENKEPERKKPAGKNKSEKKKKERSIRKPKKKQKEGIGIVILIILLLTGLMIVMKLNYLTTTQGGGIAFLIVGIFGFVLSEQKKEIRESSEKKEEIKQKKKQKILEKKEEKDSAVTTVLWEGEEEYQPRLSLIGMNSRDRITVILQKNSYLVGKQKSKVDICIDDPAVSRIHAKITKEGEFYYVSDMNSTNGTFYNGRRLEAGEKIKLELTDEVTFADSGFYIGNC